MILFDIRVTTTVNRRVVGSSPTGGAISEALNLNGFRAFPFFKTV